MKKIIKLIFLFLAVALIISSCGIAPKSEKTSQPPSPTASDTLTEAEKQAAELEKIVEEVLDKEHEHVWVFKHFQEVHPHSAVYECKCGATFLKYDEQADFKMTIIGPSEVHPHYMVEECSICKQHFVNENLPTKLTWLLSGYQSEHPHYAIIKCSQCDFTYIEYNTTAESRGVCKMQSTEAQAEHPHYLIFECTFEGCDYSFVDKNITAEYELETDENNYGVAHPHFLYASCTYDGCSYSEKTNAIADWEWDEDGVCSICGQAKDVLYKASETSVAVTGTVIEGHEGHLHIPGFIEGKPVDAIEAEAFYEKTQITSVYIPDSVMIIGRNAFENCINLQLEPLEKCPLCGIEPGLRIEPDCPVCKLFEDNPESGHPIGNIGRNVAIIEEAAFRNCTGLWSVCFGENLVEIREMAFEGCQNLTHVSFMSMTAPMIGPDTFAGAALEFEIFVPAGSTGYDTAEWAQYNVVYIEYADLQ